VSNRAARGLRRSGRARRVCLIGGVTTLALLLLCIPAWGDVYANIAPAPQVPGGGVFGRYPLSHYQLDQFFPAIKVGLFSGIDVTGVPPMIAFFLAQVLWLVTAFLANAVITIFAFCFSLDLLDGNGSPGSGVLEPVSQAIHNIYASTFGTPWLIAAVSLVALWAMWKALVQRRYTETAGALAVSLLCCVVGLGIVIAPQRTITPTSQLVNQTSGALLSITSRGDLTSEGQAKQAASDQLFDLLVLQPWTVLEFGGVEHCTTTAGGKTQPVAVRPLASNPTQESALATRLENTAEVHADGKTCIDNLLKYAPHFLTYEAQSPERSAEYKALEHGSDSDLPSSDPAKDGGGYPLGPADEPAAEAAGKGGQYERLLLALVIFIGELGAFLLLGSLAIGVLVAAVLFLLHLALAPFAVVLGVIPGRGHDFFRNWLTRMAGYLLRKVIYSLILSLVLAVSQALADATSNLGWLMAFALQTGFLWTVFLQRDRLAGDLLAATAGVRAGNEGLSRLQSLYYTSRLARMGGLHRHRQPTAAAERGSAGAATGAPPPSDPPPMRPPAPFRAYPAPVPTPSAPGLPAGSPPNLERAETPLALPPGEPPTEETP
jgi:hypothetical protein